jgi:phage terminase small subunit
MIKSNLEPIEESDMNFEEKLKSQGEGQEQEISANFEIEKEKPQEIVAAEKDSAYGKILSKVQTQSDDVLDQNVIVDDAKMGAQMIDAESQVRHLIDIAGQKGVVHAVKVAQHMQDNYVLDTFHDRMLSEELHDALISKGMIKEI